MSKLDKTDAVAVLGRREDVIGTVQQLDKEFGDELDAAKTWGTGENPEKSENPIDNKHNNLIAVESKGIKDFGTTMKATDMAEAAATAIVHGAGHNSGLNHGGDRLRIAAMEYIPIPMGIMSSAKQMYNQIVLSGSPTRTFQKLQDHINYPENKEGIIHQKYIDRFGQKNPVPKLPVFPLPKQ